MVIKVKVNGKEYVPDIIERECTGIECWYNRHLRLWTLYPVDAEGNQLSEATFVYGKTDAKANKQAMEAGLIGKKF